MADDLTALNDEVHDMANLSEARTGVPGVIWISTQVARHGPRVKYFEKPGKGQPSFSVSIEEGPKVVAGDLPEPVIKRMSPEVAEWVRLNRDALLAFWNEGDTWMKEEVDAMIDGLVRLP
jgi:1-acyl-sn-glycerol-3-phosphate acyltransferase